MLAKDIGKQLLIAAVVLFFLLKILKPFLKSLTPPAALPPPAEQGQLADGSAAAGQLPGQVDEAAIQAIQKSIFDENLKRAKQLALDEPAIVANVVKDWMGKNG
jgi:flagellar M-ring protein FliF